jgi:hypothetical protein
LINLEKETAELKSTKAAILQPDSEFFNLNTTDFELFFAIASHPKLNEYMAIMLVQIAMEVARKHIVFTRASLKLVL